MSTIVNKYKKKKNILFYNKIIYLGIRGQTVSGCH